MSGSQALRTDVPLPPEVRDVAESLIAALGDDLRAVLWHGSYARGEAKPDSDHDLIIVLRRADDDILRRMADVFRERKDWSTFVQTEEEMRQFPLDGRLQFSFGYLPLFGEFEPLPYTCENVVNDLRVLARDIRFECRYRLMHSEPLYSGEDKRRPGFQAQRNARMLRYAAKWCVLALKARELLSGQPYPVTREELRTRLTDADEIAIVDVIENWAELRPQYEEDATPLALMLDAFARNLVAGLPEP